jgi:hypothetical protein
MGRWLVLLITTGCRLGFDNVDPASNGDDQQGSGSGSNVMQLTCGAPQRFVVGADLTGIAASPTSEGFAVATVDSDGAVKGWSFTLDGGALTPKAQNISLGANGNGTVGIANAGNTILVAAQTSMGTTLSSHSAADLSQLAPPSVRTDFAGPVPLSSVGGTFAYISQLADTSIELRQVDAMANDVGSTLTLTTMPDNAYSPTVVAGPNGFAVVYGAWHIEGGAAIALYDTNMAPLIAPQEIEPNPDYFAEQPVLAYAATSNTYLVAWHQKDAMNFDFVYARLLGPDFTPVGEPFEVATYSDGESIATDGTSFFLSYITYDPAMLVPDQLAASRISSTGALTPVSITGDGGTPAQWTFVQRNGQTVLVWQETNGSGPDLYFDPMCGG